MHSCEPDAHSTTGVLGEAGPLEREDWKHVAFPRFLVNVVRLVDDLKTHVIRKLRLFQTCSDENLWITQSILDGIFQKLEETGLQNLPIKFEGFRCLHQRVLEAKLKLNVLQGDLVFKFWRDVF